MSKHLRKLNIGGNETYVNEYVPGDHISFETQEDGTIKINGEAGGGGDPEECKQYSMSWNDDNNALQLSDDKSAAVQSEPIHFKHLRVDDETSNEFIEVDTETPSASMSDGVKTALQSALDIVAFTSTGGNTTDTIPANGRKVVTINNVAPDGYTIAAYRQVSIGSGDGGTNWQKCNIQFFSTTGSGKNAQVAVTNNGSAAASVTVTVTCLCMKTD